MNYALAQTPSAQNSSTQPDALSPGSKQATANSITSDLGYIGASEPVTTASIYGQGVRQTEWQSPEQEQQGFHLPPGFSIQLFASEPQIDKPLNMAWDSRGRLWISNTIEYPYPAEQGKVPRDSIKILEDTNGDGRADKITTFADGLNIPMGLLPVEDGVICFSIPSIWHLRDNDGDDRVDERIELLGPFDTSRDTHGMINALRRGADGWVYACHGFNNQSIVTAQDGSKVHLISGNTFRFQDDGSRIEQFTSGQVNPFGMTQDEYGNWYTADCHSKPLTALMQGACYPSFGRPHDGLGFAPSMMDHLHGSTAISGLLYYQSRHFPTAYRKLFYSGNVMTSRINCNRLVWQGSTAVGEELPDFLTSDDPWFRPVDIQLGFDGALYVADFYNKIIGHYEVPLTHPGRDRTSGRIWRIACEATTAKANDEAWIGLSSPLAMHGADLANPTRRRADIERLIADPRVTAEDLESQLVSRGGSLSDVMFVEALVRRKQLTQSTVERLASAEMSNRQLGVLFVMAGSWSRDLQPPFLHLARRCLSVAQQSDEEIDAHLLRPAVELIGRAGNIHDVSALLEVVEKQAGNDPVLAHAGRIAVRDLVVQEDNLKAVTDELSDPATGRLPAAFLRIIPGIDTSFAAVLLSEQVGRHHREDSQLVELAFQQLVKHLGSGEIPSSQIVEFLGLLATGQAIEETAEHVSRVADAYGVQTGKIPTSIKEFGSQLLSEGLLPQLRKKLGDRVGLEWSEDRNRIWQFQKRQLGSRETARLRSSHTLGETYTGSLRSESFECPAEIRFWLAGHNRPPFEDDQHLNFAQLIDSRTGASLITAFVPRNDTAQEVVWDTSEWIGKPCHIELVDGDGGGAYAWIAAGEFSIAALNSADAVEEVATLERVLQAGAFVSGQATMAAMKSLPFGRFTLARLKANVAHGMQQPLLETLILKTISLGRLDLIENSNTLGSQSDEDLIKLAKELCATATLSQQKQLVQDLLVSVPGFNLVATLLAQGQMSPLALQDVSVVMPDTLRADVRTQLSAAIEQSSALSQESNVASVDERLSQLDWSAASSSLGRQLYEQHCAACHQLHGLGKVIGPQLDGAVARGTQRLAEDLLNPNLNVDLAFRRSTLLLEDDRIVTGLATDQADGAIMLTTQDGQQSIYPPSQVQQRKETKQSFMPSNFGELLGDHQLASLLHFLVEDPRATVKSAVAD